MANTTEDLLYRCRIRDHGHLSISSCQVSVLNVAGRASINANFETWWAPVNEIDCLLMFDFVYSPISFNRAHISAINQAAGHVFITWGLYTVSKEHVLLKSIACHLVYWRCRLCAVSRVNWCKRCQHEVTLFEGNQVCLIFIYVDIEVTRATQGDRQRGYNLRHHAIQVTKCRFLNVKSILTVSVDGWVLQSEWYINMVN